MKYYYQKYLTVPKNNVFINAYCVVNQFINRLFNRDYLGQLKLKYTVYQHKCLSVLGQGFVPNLGHSVVPNLKHNILIYNIENSRCPDLSRYFRGFNCCISINYPALGRFFFGTFRYTPQNTHCGQGKFPFTLPFTLLTHLKQIIYENCNI